MIRFATPADAEAVAAIHVDGWRAAYRGIVPDDHLAALSKEERAAGWRRGITADARSLLVFDDGGIRGWLASGRGRDDDAAGAAEIYALYVDPNHWRQSIGGALLARAEEDLWSRGFDHAVLWVLERNLPARAFYARAGYVDDGRTKTASFGETRLIELRMKKGRVAAAPWKA